MMTAGRPDKIGIYVVCATCGQQKKPLGRSGGTTARYCDDDCPGYTELPRVGSLWPGELESEFGYPCSDVGTVQVEPSS
jgi:hypothetical protein